MKVLIAFLVCIVAVFGRELSDHEKKMNEMFKDASNACVKEMNLDSRFISEVGPSTDPGLLTNSCFVACVDKKIGVMKEDGSYNLERILSLADTPFAKERAEEIYNTTVKECVSQGNNDPCKIAECVHKRTKSYYVNN